ncbi:MAG: arginine deiminase [Bacteroidales bacterium]|nr:arginine deiminase [Bacteroidales bacterium]
MDSNRINISVHSEIGKLQHVLVHTPGFELENMTPETAHVYLFSDILNMQVAQKEYGYFKKVLQKAAQVHEVRDLLTDILQNDGLKSALVDKVCKAEDKAFLGSYLKSLAADELARQLIEGIRLKDVTYINKEKYAILPLPNLFFMRDASFSMFDNVMISSMASSVRARECMLLEAIYNLHPLFETKSVNPVLKYDIHGIGTVEGGDVQIVRDDIIICGLGSRTNMHGVEALVEHLKTRPGVKHLIFQELPLTPESFIHLDMVFTMLDVDRCMAYEPVIMNNAFKTFHITIDGQKALGKEVPNLVSALQELGVNVEPVFCGGGDEDYGPREQWHSGCNFFCLEPGKFIGYGRNQHTLEALSQAGFSVITAADVVNGRVNIANVKKCIVAFEGNELSRGGGGARCMTMPLQRMAVDW